VTQFHRLSQIARHNLSRLFFASLRAKIVYADFVTVETFKQEMAEALKAYDKYVICIDKTPDQFQASLVSLMMKAIHAYENRGPGFRHGIAVDPHLTVILSENDNPKPLCGIYFNLQSPYQKDALPKTVKAIAERKDETRKPAGN
jgi:hypothetical protein